MPTQRNDRPVWVNLGPAGVTAFSSHHSRRFFMPAMAHVFEKICLVEAGRGRLVCGSREQALAAGDVVRIASGTTHRFVDSQEDPMSLMVLCFDAVIFAQPASVRRAWQRLVARLPSCVARGPLTGYTRMLVSETIGRVLHEKGVGKEEADAMAISLTTQFVIQLSRALVSHTRHDHEQIDAAIAWLDDHFTGKVSVEDLAEIAGISYRSLTSHFQTRTGMTVVQYVTRKRIDYAKRRLLETNDIAASALEAGFGDITHFYRVFARYEGHPPGELRRRAQGKRK